MLSFKQTFSLSSFTFIKRFFGSSSLPTIRVMSSACLRLLIFLLAILILAGASSSPVFHMMYSAYKLNKQVTIYGLDILLSQFSLRIFHKIKGFRVVNEAELDIFLEFCYFYDLMDLGNLISGFFAFSKANLHICKFSVHVLLKPSLKDFEHYLASIQNECNCAVV